MAKYNIQRGGGISHFTQDVNGNQHELRNLKKIAVETVEASKIVLNPETGEFYSGYPLMGTYAEDISAYSVVSINTESQFYKSNVEISSDFVIGITLEDGLADESHKILMMGIVNNLAFNFTVGSKLYLGSVPGSITETPPAEYDHQLVGMAISPTKLLFYLGKQLTGNDMLADSSVTEAKLATSSVSTLKLQDAAVINSKLANMVEYSVKGRKTTGTGIPEDISMGELRTILNVEDGANFYVHPGNHPESDITFDIATGHDHSGVNSKKILHSQIDQINSGDHHIRYADSEARSAMGLKSPTNPLYHEKFTEGEAQVAAVDNTPYDPTSWNDIINKSPSKNAVRDKIEELIAIINALGSTLELQNEGISLDLEVSKINFLGAGVNATENTDHEIDVIISKDIDGGAAATVFSTPQNIDGGNA